MDEANRLKGQLFNPKKEFEKKDGLKLYFLFNVYLENYSSAKFMLSIADSQETGLRNEFLRYDLRTDDIHDDQKRKHTHQFMLQCGMFYISAITFFFMALEGFVNIVFHAFLKKDLRDKDLNIEQRFDLEQKLKLMPYLCSGFKDEYIDQSSEIYSRFKELKKYRNSLFHSKVEDSLKRFCFVESGFTYTYDMDKDKEFLPLHKIELTINDVIKVQAIVDETINLILNSMTEAIRTLTEKYILNESLVSFWISDNGELFLGERGEQPQTLV